MDKLLQKLDEIFEKYGVDPEEIKEVADIINKMNGELEQEGEEFNAPEMGDSEDGEDEYAEED